MVRAVTFFASHGDPRYDVLVDEGLGVEDVGCIALESFAGNGICGATTVELV
jgi:hypothetical protein